MDVLSLNQRFIRELLELYRELPAVWKIKCPDYKNKVAKARAYDLLVQKCKEYVPDADREFVKNKINSLRTSFRKELRKVEASQAKAKDAGDVYVPNLWYYNMLTFTAAQEYTNHNNSSSILNKNDTPSFYEEDAASSGDEDGFFDFKSEPKSPRILIEERDPLSPTHETTVAKKKPRLELVAPSSVPSSIVPDDVFDAIGKNVAHKLRGMSQQQRIIAEKIISDVMYHGQMETLTIDAQLTLDRSSS